MQAGSTAAGRIIEGEGGAKLLRDIAIVTHCVADLDTATAQWRTVLDYAVVESGRLGSDACAAWDAPAAAGQRYALLQPASGEPCYLRFVETGERGHGPPASWGWMATELLVQDPDALAGRFTGTGFRRLSGPGDLYPRPNAPRAMQVIGPSGELLYFTRLLPGGSRYGLRQARSWVDRPFICTLGGPASAGMHDFYAGVPRPPHHGAHAIRQWHARHALRGTTRNPCFRPRWRASRDGASCWRWTTFPEHIGRRRRAAGQLPAGMSMVSFVVRSLAAVEALRPAGGGAAGAAATAAGCGLWRTAGGGDRGCGRRMARADRGSVATLSARQQPARKHSPAAALPCGGIMPITPGSHACAGSPSSPQSSSVRRHWQRTRPRHRRKPRGWLRHWSCARAARRCARIRAGGGRGSSWCAATTREWCRRCRRWRPASGCCGRSPMPRRWRPLPMPTPSWACAARNSWRRHARRCGSSCSRPAASAAWRFRSCASASCC
jgi:hypothetical protein